MSSCVYGSSVRHTAVAISSPVMWRRIRRSTSAGDGVVVGVGAEGVAHLAHEHRGLDAAAGDVPDRDEHDAVASADDVVPVAADLEARRCPPGSGRAARRLRSRADPATAGCAAGSRRRRARARSCARGSSACAASSAYQATCACSVLVERRARRRRAGRARRSPGRRARAAERSRASAPRRREVRMELWELRPQLLPRSRARTPRPTRTRASPRWAVTRSVASALGSQGPSPAASSRPRRSSASSATTESASGNAAASAVREAVRHLGGDATPSPSACDSSPR